MRLRRWLRDRNRQWRHTRPVVFRTSYWIHLPFATSTIANDNILTKPKVYVGPKIIWNKLLLDPDKCSENILFRNQGFWRRLRPPVWNPVPKAHVFTNYWRSLSRWSSSPNRVFEKGILWYGTVYTWNISSLINMIDTITYIHTTRGVY